MLSLLYSIYCIAKWISHTYTYIVSLLDFLPIQRDVSHKGQWWRPKFCFAHGWLKGTQRTPVFSLHPDKFAFKTLNWENLNFKTQNIFLSPMLVFNSSYLLLEIANKNFPIPVYTHSLLCFSSHTECWTAGHVDNTIVPLPSWPQDPLQF